ncbi:sugar transferase [Geobacillus sp. 46C-IIa]|uniref:sugar transferase n=1 Tax=Geobacillus sp. 46C-IIa TaxID=1963025 RepID=UPI0009C12141|nr:sugar transferase [Geobacillus sp. 46C-IIa]OQP03961.1 sugar transferase [Geobacillus sp. 46C-IIa]
MKRSFDFIVSLIALAVLSPIMAVTAILVRWKLGSPVLFKQQRPGLHGKPFYLYKFRTMTDERDENGELLPDHLRLTQFGQFLRKFSLDELPQLYNILKGDMSFVGPRPLLMKYFPYYTDREKKRHNVRPGITGLAQVSGRNNLGWDERLELDVKYVENYSFWLDLKIIFLTIKKVLKSEDVVIDPRSTMKDLDEERSVRQEKTVIK